MHSHHPAASGPATPSPVDPAVIDAMLDQAVAALETGRLAEAQAGFEAVLRLDATQFDAWNLLGVLTMHARDFPKAIGMFEHALAIAPDEAMAHVNMGVAWMESQQPDKALPCFDRALALEPDHVEALFPQSLAQLALAQWEAALLSSTQTLTQQPDHVEAHFNQGRALLALKRHEEALAAYNRVLALQPRHVSALINRGLVLTALARHAEALSSYDQAIALEPTRPSAHAKRSDLLQAMNRFDEALASCEQSLALQAEQLDQLVTRGNILRQLKRLPEAIGSYEQALKLDPDSVIALTNLGGILREVGRWDLGMAHCDRAIALDPHFLGAHINRAGSLLDTGRWTQARDAFAQIESQAEPHTPESAQAIWGQAWCNLLMGDWARGLAQFESRWHKPDLPPAEQRSFTQPLWLGDVDLRGRTILLYAEQGLGDTLQFCRYAPMVAALGAKVILEVQAPLKKLMQSLAGPIQVVARGTYPMPAFDCRCPLMSLPLAFKTTPATVPTPTPYLRAEPELIKNWSRRLGDQTRPRIGIVWSGNPAHRNNANRSLPLATLLSALPSGIDAYVLQKDIQPADLATLQAHDEVIHLSQALQNFNDTAALLANMDVVITVDTSIAHLAAALGRPTWVLLSTILDWRWLLDRDDSPWYGSARLFRQTTVGDWAEPLQKLAHALKVQMAQVPPAQRPYTLH